VYGHFACERKGNLLFVKGERLTFKFDFPRERADPHRCLADFFQDGFVTMMLVTIGNEVAKAGADLFKRDKYTDAFYLKGFASESTEALASYAHRRIAVELGLDEDAGTRFAFGYPACPDLMDQEKLYKLLGGNRIGVVLSKTMQLIPEHSTSAIVSFDPKATRFIP
jgi:5-methyltetrahydrofolate--homocysteine methyltransferase